MCVRGGWEKGESRISCSLRLYVIKFFKNFLPYHDVQFYASWCEHSQAAEPEFLKAIQMLSDSNVTGMYIGKIDITKHGGKI